VLRQHGAYVLVSAGLGATVGASELVSRYRDEPLRALGSLSAVWYLFLNAGVSAFAYGILTRYGHSIAPALVNDRLMTSFVAGFGAMALVRSKFFTLRTEKGEDIAVGPDAAVSAFLAAADRGVDRSRAAKRMDLVIRRTTEISNFEHTGSFIEASLAAFQNLSNDEKAALTNEIASVYEKTALPPRLKLQAICYGLLRITGEKNFNQLMTGLERYTNQQTENPSSEGEAG
jgi:hypothetical protein